MCTRDPKKFVAEMHAALEADGDDWGDHYEDMVEAVDIIETLMQQAEEAWDEGYRCGANNAGH